MKRRLGLCGLGAEPLAYVLDTAVVYRLVLDNFAGGSIFYVVAEGVVQVEDIADVMGKKRGCQPLLCLQRIRAFWMFGSVVGADNPVPNRKTRDILAALSNAHVLRISETELYLRVDPGH